MKKLILLLAVIASGFLLQISAVTYLTNYDKICSDFMKSVKIETPKAGAFNYKIKKFPFPSLIIKHALQPGKIELKDIEIKFSPLQILIFRHQISEVKIGEAQIYLTNDNVNLLEHDKFISELINQGILDISAKIDRLSFVESDKDVPLIIENFVFARTGGTIKFIGEVNSAGSLKGEFAGEKELVNFNLELKGQSYALELNEKYNNSLFTSGNAEVTFLNPIPELMFLVPDFISLPTNLLSGQEVKAKFEIESLPDQLNLKNMVIASPSAAGTGEISLSKNRQGTNTINLNFSRVDFNNENASAPGNRHAGLPGRFELNKRLLQAHIFIQQAQLNNNEFISNLNLSFLTKDGELEVEDFSGDLAPNGRFKLRGGISHNSFRSIFNGSLELTHNDLNKLVAQMQDNQPASEHPIPYTLVSDVKISPVDLSLQNLLIKTPESEISGSISTKFIGNTPRTSARLNFTKINLDDDSFPALNKIYNYGLSLLAGSKQEDYLNNFIPLRKINSINSYDIVIDQLTLGGVLYRNVDFNLGLSQGKVRLEDLALGDGKNYIDVTMELAASGVKPAFSVVINDGIIETAYLSPRGLLELRKKILNNIAFDKVDFTIDGSLKKIYQEDSGFEKVVFKVKNNKSLLEIGNLEADTLGGRVVASGSILLDPYTINFVYALNSAIVSEIAKTMPAGILESGGVISLSGMLSTNGSSLEEQLYNLYTKTEIVAKGLSVNNFSIDDLAQQVNKPDYDIKNLQDDTKKALLTGKTEISELKADMELAKGVFTLPQIIFKTKYATAAASANLNLYDLNLNLSSLFSFYLTKPVYGRSYKDYAPAKLGITATGNLLTPKKEADTKALEELLNSIIKKK